MYVFVCVDLVIKSTELGGTVISDSGRWMARARASVRAGARARARAVAEAGAGARAGNIARAQARAAGFSWIFGFYRERTKSQQNRGGEAPQGGQERAKEHPGTPV